MTSGSAVAGPVSQFGLALYRRPGVADACLDLQSRHDLDVNLVLFAAFVGAVRRQVLTGTDLSLVHARVDAWHQEVVRPLRAVRQRLRSGPAPAPDEATTALRRKIAQLEIEAELIELGQLDALTAHLHPLGNPAGAVEGATAAIEAVITTHSATAPGPADRQAVATIAAEADRVDALMTAQFTRLPWAASDPVEGGAHAAAVRSSELNPGDAQLRHPQRDQDRGRAQGGSGQPRRHRHRP